MTTQRFVSFQLLILALTACGGPPKAPEAPETKVEEPAPSAPAPAETASAAKPPAAPPDDHHDPKESAEPIRMEPLFAKNTPKAKFPKVTAGDKTCWQEVGLTGDHQKDYDQLAAKCGAPTGLLEYVKPATGRLHHKHDKRDTYMVKLHAGFCYRYFAVGDGPTTDIDILITHPNGALIADDKATSPVAIIHNDKPWCMDEDAEYHFHVEVDGPGKGAYVFAIWARPKGLPSLAEVRELPRLGITDHAGAIARAKLSQTASVRR